MTLALLFPGQGSQAPGMGASDFDAFPELVREADEILGYPVRDLCAGQDLRLRDTRYAQPALFVTGALAARSRSERAGRPAFLAGHSLGELTALHVAGCFDFATGVTLAKRRGELMAQATGGGMTAVLGMGAERLRELLAESGEDGVTLANHNLPDQLVLSGPLDALRRIAPLLTADGRVRCVPLNVAVAAHSRHMERAAQEFARTLRGIHLAAPEVPVVANVTARPYGPDEVAELLTRHLVSPVRWWDTLCLLADSGVDRIEETGPGEVLTKMWRKAGPQLAARRAADVRALPTTVVPPAAPPPPPAAPPPPDVRPHRPARSAGGPEHLGSAAFRRDYGTAYAYAAGSLADGVSGPAMLARLAARGLLGFLGTVGRSVEDITADLDRLADVAGPYGLALPTVAAPASHLDEVVRLGLARGLRHAEASAAGGVSEPLVRWRFTGARRGPDGVPVAGRQLLVKVARTAQADAFLAPAPPALVTRLTDRGELTEEEAWAARRLPVAGDVCAESGPGWLTSDLAGPALLPAVLALRDRVGPRHGYAEPPRVGACGGLGDPGSVAAAFLRGADFVLTGSVNQAAPEARTSTAVKELLAGIGVDDTAQAPAEALFELGGRTRVTTAGTLFAARADALHQAYRAHASLDALDATTRRRFEDTIFHEPLAAVWERLREDLTPERRARADRDDRHRMALVMRTYPTRATLLALTGDPRGRRDYQIPCGPAMGAFNDWARDTPFAAPDHRHVDAIALALLEGAAELGAGRPAPAARGARTPSVA
ncbi:ACP S-malonyltransferase [Streptomyces tendae]|uniref:ACP S-malonyltransferase n=1 Tax=Streptomyces tendae TaxID=1932 RepID=UPI0036964794